MNNNFLKNSFLIAICTVFFGFSAFASDFSVQKGTLLPETQIKLTIDCQSLMQSIKNEGLKVKQDVFVDRGTYKINLGGDDYEVDMNDIMGCGIKTGSMTLWMVPFYARYILEFILGIAGLVAIAAIVYGAYLYLISGLSDKKEQGKNAIIYGLAGFVLSMLAWGIVNIVLAVFTG
ncbi:MAG: pilin [Candidatus Gracilibacteria bacterium]|jgi:hypothetical protein|nr:pilin [Candidatus Gracilibacteria bacterium]